MMHGSDDLPWECSALSWFRPVPLVELVILLFNYEQAAGINISPLHLHSFSSQCFLARNSQYLHFSVQFLQVKTNIGCL